TYRQVCKQVGREMQAFPCFMPKPFMGVSANGCHHNISLWEGDDNKFMPAEGEDQRMPGQIGKWAIGGILEHLGALTAITASTVNSYLSLAALIKAMDDGIQRKLDPGPPEERNIYQAIEAGKDVKKIPMTFG